MLRLIFVVCLIFSVMTSQVSASGKKDPALAGILSVIIPGGGQFYNGEAGKAMIPIGGAIAFLTLSYLASEDGASYSLYGYDSDVDDDDYLAGVGFLVVLCTQTYGVIDAIFSANRINRQRKNQFGHLIEFDGDKATLGVDPIASRKQLGTMLSLRF